MSTLTSAMLAMPRPLIDVRMTQPACPCAGARQHSAVPAAAGATVRARPGGCALLVQRPCRLLWRLVALGRQVALLCCAALDLFAHCTRQFCEGIHVAFHWQVLQHLLYTPVNSPGSCGVYGSVRLINAA